MQFYSHHGYILLLLMCIELNIVMLVNVSFVDDISRTYC